jgi:hypothetical protein
MSTLSAHMSSRRRLMVAAALPLAALTVLSAAGCRRTGSEAATPPPSAASTATASPSPNADAITDRSADDIRDAAVINFAMASSFHVRGYVTTGSGRKETIDLVSSGGHDGRLVMTDDEGSLELIRIGKVLYVKGPREYWRPSGSAAVKLMDGKYLKTPTTESHFASFNGYFDMNQFMPMQRLTKGPVGDVNGTPAIALADPDPRNGGTLYVSTEGTPYPLRIQSTAGLVSLDFSEYGLPAQITAPPASRTVSIDKLLQVVNG